MMDALLVKSMYEAYTYSVVSLSLTCAEFLGNGYLWMTRRDYRYVNLKYYKTQDKN